MDKTRTSILLTLLLLLFWGASARADESSSAAMRSLDEQVQEIKSDVLDIAAELSLLEEQLLFPSNTQLAVFVVLEGGESVRLDAVELDIDGAPATRYIYSFKELEALQHGGVQRLYTGNIPRGSHALDVSIVGKSVGGQDFSVSRSFTFSKGVEPQMLGLTIGGADGRSIELASW